MQDFRLSAAVLTALIGSTWAWTMPATAQTTPTQAKNPPILLAQAAMTRAEIKADRDAFLKDHTWNAQVGDWEHRDGHKDPAGASAATRAKIKAERDAYLKANRWDEDSASFVSAGPEPRNVGNMSRDQIKAETAEFYRMFDWNPATGQFEKRTVPLSKKK